ncbi:short-chain fatty acyl-CoA regulator family protein [Paracoccus spongiarum]|uniref:Short-chain fatty acyl-CoA regulator family protein n=1 Tax=Paracoccus spongiarum TaxID=3064387 RepID=A0ABT9JGC9_9RHOB|nr:short-chain fatty acyl-CoA regulator family protein [Paracoccus sp. 2205BS29-5]MDP5308892.1 short-chain fatty acyl-CoA regulator family protein [Paracoccus sp. 2205BS29-5]
MSQRAPTTHVLTGTRIRERRLALSRRQADVARAAGISPAYLNLIEHNRRPVGEELVQRLAEVLEVPSEELAEGREEARIAALREAAARLPDAARGLAPELGQTPEFLARFPGWAAVLVATARRSEALERQLVALSDRMTQDPYLLTTLHEVLSAVTSVRSTASILSEGDEVSPEWRARFHANLNEDSLRLSTTAQALVRYIDSFETDGAIFTPQEEVEAWMAAGAPPVDEADDLASDAARAMAQEHLDCAAADRALLPDVALAEVAAAEPDPLRIAARLGRPLDLVMRRLAALRPWRFERAGLLVCDGSGALTLRQPAPGFPLPRPGDSCPLWPLYQALAAPQTAMAHLVVAPDGRRFSTLSHATRSQPDGTGGPVLTRAQMLILPAEAGQGAGSEASIAIGPACRICPRPDCPARREPSILGMR